MRTKPVLVRIHSECLTGDVFGSLRCDCGEQVELALTALAKEGVRRFSYTCGRKAGESACTTRSRLTPCKSRAWTP